MCASFSSLIYRAPPLKPKSSCAPCSRLRSVCPARFSTDNCSLTGRPHSSPCALCCICFPRALNSILGLCCIFCLGRTLLKPLCAVLQAEIVQRVLEVQALPGALPAQMVRPVEGTLRWFLDISSAQVCFRSTVQCCAMLCGHFILPLHLTSYCGGNRAVVTYVGKRG